jgi:hypothetical protein
MVRLVQCGVRECRQTGSDIWMRGRQRASHKQEKEQRKRNSTIQYVHEGAIGRVVPRLGLRLVRCRSSFAVAVAVAVGIAEAGRGGLRVLFLVHVHARRAGQERVAQVRGVLLLVDERPAPLLGLGGVGDVATAAFVTVFVRRPRRAAAVAVDFVEATEKPVAPPRVEPSAPLHVARSLGLHACPRDQVAHHAAVRRGQLAHLVLVPAR